ncbi:TRAP transporter permease [Bacillus sp. Marseille-P3661]|uniref:TRAP transporter permease n=1 Tax=Bacillus sp. Marseille-P3661 TaxID=1936234 RepID=UPI000C819EDE|nr:TRAP transporter fused permease subunit [Bacillus sp. Marseille-P3661]
MDSGIPKGGSTITTSKKVLNIIAGITALYEIIVISGLPTMLGFIVPATVHRAISLIFILILVFLRFGQQNDTGNSKIRKALDVIFLLMGLVGTAYVALFYNSRVIEYSSYGYLDVLGIFLALFLAISLLEAVRRLTGWVLPILIVIMLLMASYQHFLPGLLHGPGFTLDRLTYAFYVGTGGIYGLPLGIATSIIIVFLIFGQLLQKSGAGDWFLDLAIAITGWSRGGPAKAAVLGSAFLGSLSGSPSSNVATSGVITIPLMKKIGYKPAFAGGVEAVASTGGMILPPVMGSVAFIMAEWLNVSYLDIMKAAVIPALLYYLVLFLSVHLNAVKMNIPSTPKKDLPKILPVFLSGWYYLPPILILFYFITIQQQSPEIAGLYSLPFIVLFSFFSKNPKHRLTPKNIWESFIECIPAWLIIAVVTASVGMLIGAFQLSGLGVKISSFIVDIGMGNLILTLILIGIVSLILGMGLDVISAYVTLATLTAPALVTLGLTAMQAHLYVVFWGLASFITPPVCLAVYVACSISKSNVWETGFEAVRLGAATFLISIAFAYNPELLMEGTFVQVLLVTLKIIISGLLIAVSLQGFALTTLNMPLRIIVFMNALLYFGSNTYVLITAACLTIVLVILQLITRRNSSIQINTNM